MRIFLVLSVFGLSCLSLWACEPDGVLRCNAKKACPVGLVCIDEICEKKRCSVDEQCDFNEFCDKAKRQCQKKKGAQWTCRTQADCRSGEKCVAGFCRLSNSERTIPDKDPNKCEPTCAEGSRCERGSCVAIPEDPKCKLDQDCESDLGCNLAVDRCQKRCTDTADCPSGRECKEQFCQHKSATECGPQRACPAPKSCKNGKCIEKSPECGPQKACPSPKVCKNGQCIEDSPTKCDAQNVCPTGKKCWKGQCTREDYCEQQSDCPQDQKCQRNHCGFCQKDSDCPTHQSCVQNKCDFVKKQFGEECIVSTQCIQGAICMGDGTGKQYCRKKCDPSSTNTGCASSEGCVLLSDKRSGACIIKRGGSALGEGKLCNPNNVQCEVDLVCVNNGGSHICMRLCNIQQQNCVNGAKCTSVSIDPVGVCESGKSGGGEGTPCAAKSQCANGLLCLKFTAGQGTCTPQCDPYQPVCSSAKVCDLIVDYKNKALQAGVCGPFVSGVGEGKICNYNYHSVGQCPPGQQCLCQSNLFCFPYLKDLSKSLCARPCSPTTKLCPSGMQCVPSPVTWKGSNLWGCI